MLIYASWHLKVLMKSSRAIVLTTHKRKIRQECLIQRVKKNSDLTELTAYTIGELVKAVYVEAPDNQAVRESGRYTFAMTS